ncbi:hypothetical protein QOZ34_32025, partial [Pseudomonas aeruginosa]|uniref:hypothetical protein n=1 Tax=Pseudomonas aeruginosa TaxID=287 RepID=UPI0034583B02
RYFEENDLVSYGTYGSTAVEPFKYPGQAGSDPSCESLDYIYISPEHWKSSLFCADFSSLYTI